VVHVINKENAHNASHEPTIVTREFYCSLEELYHGITKKMRVKRQRLNIDGQTTHEEEKILTIEVKPGWKSGTKITFPKEGDEKPGITPADIQFILKEKPHDRFKRNGNDLIYRYSCSLKQALLGLTIDVHTLDQRKLRIPINKIISPGYTHKVIGEGMPISKSPHEKGNLIIEFDINFPNRLTEHQKKLINDAFDH